MSFCFINGSYEYQNEALISVEDRGFNFSDGVYEVISFRLNKLLNFDKHLKRLNYSLSELKIISPFSNYKSLNIISKYLLKINNLSDGFLYLQITRGTASRNHLFPKNPEPNIIIFTFANKNLEKIKNGVKICLNNDYRWLRCDIKSISLLSNVLEKQKGYERGFFETWLMRNNKITEGTTSNAFIINKKNQIITHPLNHKILGGVTRDNVLEIAEQNSIKVIEKPFNIKDIKDCSEAFLTSTTLGVIPVIQIEDMIINNKRVGLITKMLAHKYEEFLTRQTYEK